MTHNKTHLLIYKKYYGHIPIDETGRVYDIHHKDGNHKNNDPKNLVAVPIYIHYIIHWLKRNWGACYFLARRMKLSPEIISELNRKAAYKRVEEGTHPWVGGEIHRKRVANGTHNLLGGETSRKITAERLADGSHNFLNKEWAKLRTKKNIQEGTHNTCKIYNCSCGKTGKGPRMIHHLKNCKIK